MICGVCQGEMNFTGVLGKYYHFRCRDCGCENMLSKHEVPEEVLDDLK